MSESSLQNSNLTGLRCTSSAAQEEPEEELFAPNVLQAQAKNDCNRVDRCQHETADSEMGPHCVVAPEMPTNATWGHIEKGLALC